MYLQEVLSIGHEEALSGVPRLAAGCLSETATFETSQFASVAFLDKRLDKTPVGGERRVRKRYSRGWGPGNVTFAGADATGNASYARDDATGNATVAATLRL